MRYLFWTGLGAALSLAGIIVFLAATHETRVTWLHTTVTHDPLFYIPAVEQDALARSISSLQEAERSAFETVLLHTHKQKLSSGEERVLKTVLNEGVLPLSYLELLPLNIERTATFLEHPTYVKGLQLLLLQYKTAQTYRREAYRLSDLSQQASKAAGDEFVFASFASQINSAVWFHDTALLKANSSELVQISRERIVCYLLGINCSSTTLPRPTASAVPTGSIRPTSAPALPDDLVNILNMPQRYGPFVIETSCFPQRTVSLYLFRGSSTGFLPKQVDENYYLDIHSMLGNQELASNPYAKHYLDQGIDLLIQPEGASYRCTDLRYWGDVAVLAYFSDQFPNAQIHTLADVERLLTTLDQDDSDKARYYRQVFSNRIVYLPDMLQHIARMLRSYERDADYSRTTPFYLLVIRSHYALTFMTFSSSVWKLDESPQYTSRPNIPLLIGLRAHSSFRNPQTDDHAIFAEAVLPVLPSN